MVRGRGAGMVPNVMALERTIGVSGRIHPENTKALKEDLGDLGS